MWRLVRIHVEEKPLEPANKAPNDSCTCLVARKPVVIVGIDNEELGRISKQLELPKYVQNPGKSLSSQL